MPYLNQSSNIPGLATQFKDGGLVLRTETVQANTRSVLLLGTAIDGPINEPFAVDSSSAELVFGKSVDLNGRPNGSTLPEQFVQLWKEGCRDIRMMRVSGANAKAVISGGSISTIETLVSGQEIATFGGNPAVSCTLAQFPVVAGSFGVRVRKDGKSLPVIESKYTVNNATGAFTMAADKVDAHVDVTASYKYNRGAVASTVNTPNANVSFVNTQATNFFYGDRSNTGSIALVVEAGGVSNHNHMIMINTTVKPANSRMQFNLDDGNTQTVEDNDIEWGPVGGFPLVAGTQTCNTIIKADKPGNYTVVIKLVDLDDSNAVVTQETFTVTVSEVTVTGEVLLAAADNTIDPQVITLDQLPMSIDGDLQFALRIADVNIDGQLLIAINSKRSSTSQLIMSDLFSVEDDVVTIKSDNIVHKNIKVGSPIYASYYYLQSDVSEIATIELESVYGGSIYNETTLEVRDVDGVIEVVIEKPLYKRASTSELPLVYSTIKYPLFSDLVNAINADPKNQLVKAATAFPEVLCESIIPSSMKQFEDGADGVNLTKQQLFEALSGGKLENGLPNPEKPGAYKLLQNYKVDYIIPVGVFANDQLLHEGDNFAYELALLCGIMSQVHMTHGIIAMKAPKKTDLSSLELHVKEMEAYPNVYLMKATDGTIITDNEGQPFDLGCYISVIAGPEVVVSSPRMGLYNDSGVTKYAAFESRKKVSSAPTNKKLESVSGSRYKFSVPQINRLTANRYVTFMNRASDNALVYTDGVTAALPNSDYSRIVNVDVVRAIVDDVYLAAEPFIGEPMSLANSNALSAAVEKKLHLRADPQNGDISAFSFNIVDGGSQLVGESKIELTLVPLGERRKITIVVGLKPAL